MSPWTYLNCHLHCSVPSRTASCGCTLPDIGPGVCHSARHSLGSKATPVLEKGSPSLAGRRKQCLLVTLTKFACSSSALEPATFKPLAININVYMGARTSDSLGRALHHTCWLGFIITNAAFTLKRFGDWMAYYIVTLVLHALSYVFIARRFIYREKLDPFPSYTHGNT